MGGDMGNIWERAEEGRLYSCSNGGSLSVADRGGIRMDVVGVHLIVDTSPTTFSLIVFIFWSPL
ncbi:hypothetical protein GBA52_014191 [Prunus armeniaca]|nr:hypothetical protein GBA52_014191 [Prunus armeniaca]